MKIAELFYSLQGESTQAGRPSLFIRLAGCPFHCRWCDTVHAREGGDSKTLDEVLVWAANYPCRLVEITGGEPLAQPEVHGLIAALLGRGYEVLLETSGLLPIQDVDQRVKRIVDVKCPGSGVEALNHWDNLRHLTAHDELKFVIASRRDFDYARDCLRRFPDLPCPALFSPAAGELDPALLAEWILAAGLDVRLQLQLHKLIWPGENQR